MGMGEVGEIIRDYLREEFGDGELALQDDQSLIAEEVIDSLGIFTLVSFLERRFGIELEPEDITLDNFDTVEAIADMVARKRGLGRPDG